MAKLEILKHSPTSLPSLCKRSSLLFVCSSDGLLPFSYHRLPRSSTAWLPRLNCCWRSLKRSGAPWRPRSTSRPHSSTCSAATCIACCSWTPLAPDIAPSSRDFLSSSGRWRQPATSGTFGSPGVHVTLTVSPGSVCLFSLYTETLRPKC